jgi:hypothetical protein
MSLALQALGPSVPPSYACALVKSASLSQVLCGCSTSDEKREGKKKKLEGKGDVYIRKASLPRILHQTSACISLARTGVT